LKVKCLTADALAVAENGAWALQTLVAEAAAECDPEQLSAAVDAAVAALRQHEHAGVAQQACALLSSLGPAPGAAGSAEGAGLDSAVLSTTLPPSTGAGDATRMVGTIKRLESFELVTAQARAARRHAARGAAKHTRQRKRSHPDSSVAVHVRQLAASAGAGLRRRHQQGRNADVHVRRSASCKLDAAANAAQQRTRARRAAGGRHARQRAVRKPAGGHAHGAKVARRGALRRKARPCNAHNSAASQRARHRIS
jgi:hypothetical protein